MDKADRKIQSDEFNALIAPKANKRLRDCLRCRVEFLSAHNGNRLCGSCSHQARNKSIRFQQSLGEL